MRRNSSRSRLTAWLASTSIAAASMLAGAPAASAQDAATPLQGDPPARVARLARLQGTVSTRDAGAAQWTPAVLNFPFVSGGALWTRPQAQADIEFGASIATLADNTEFDLQRLDEQGLVAAEPQGAMFLDLRDLRPGDSYMINTPHGVVQIAAEGQYEILAGDADTPTRVAVVRGAALLTVGTLALRAGQGQMAVATGTREVQGRVDPLTSYDPFLTAMLARNSAPVEAPQVVQGMTGADGLAQYGSWQRTPDYGQVWYPRVAQDWVPYRDGSWSYVAPWGWTWVDNEPWGFAPFHYGRWAQVDARWCWVPGEPGGGSDAEPVYAPALVDFVVAGAAAGLIGSSLHPGGGPGRDDIGWVPLGPREAYAPPYGGSSRYLRRLNRGEGWHRPEWGEGRDRERGGPMFINRNALTVAPAAAMARSQQIRPLAHGMDSPAARDFQAAFARPLQGPLPIRPAADTRGLPPRAARGAGVAGGPTPFRSAPGPAVAPAAAQRMPLPARAPDPRPPMPPQPPARPGMLRPTAQAVPALRLPPAAIGARPPAAARPLPPRPPQPRFEPPRQPAFRPEPPRPMMPRMEPQRLAPQPGLHGGFQGGIQGGPRPAPMMQQPHFQAPRPMATPRMAPPGPHPAGAAPHP